MPKSWLTNPWPAVSRPSRPDNIRCARQKGTKIIHNYGHGGAGWTMSWGCPLEVVKILHRMLEENEVRNALPTPVFLRPDVIIPNGERPERRPPPSLHRHKQRHYVESPSQSGPSIPTMPGRMPQYTSPPRRSRNSSPARTSPPRQPTPANSTRSPTN